jgi:hypothetical protein
VNVPTAEEVATALGREATDIADQYAAEVAAQASRCRVDPYTPALAAALVRRVNRALSMKNLPLGVTLDENAVRVGSVDPEVRRLEAPFRKVVVG